MHDMRIGQGMDVHRYSEPPDNGGIVLGGIRIPYERSLLAHSDGDVLTHALIDALMGALALGDIGGHFPDSDPRYAGISSLDLLTHTCGLVKEAGYRLVNADLTLVAQAPKLAPHRDLIRDSLAGVLSVPRDAVGVKATTSEGLGFTGRGEGIAAFATVLLRRE